MNSHSISGIAAIVVPLALTLSAPAHAVDCAAPKQPADKRICSYAAQGDEAFRRFIQRTRGIYQIYYFDYVPESRQAPPDETIAGKRQKQSRSKPS
jgi:hypothetical protein